MAGDTSMTGPDNARTENPMNVEELLRREMAIVPSPEFLPRVRERISSEPQATRWHWRLLLPAGAVAAACVAAVAMNVLSSDPVAMPPAPQPPALAIAQAIPSIELPGGLPKPRGVLPSRARVSEPRAAAPAAPMNAPVIVDERQRAALVTLIRVIRDGKLTDESFANTTPVSLTAIRDRVRPLDVPPLTVSEIGGDGVLQKER